MRIRPTHVDVELSQTRPELAEQEFIGPKTSHDVYGLSHALVCDMIKSGAFVPLSFCRASAQSIFAPRRQCMQRRLKA